VDAGEGLGDHSVQTQEAERDRGVFPGGALTVVVAADHEVAAAVGELRGPARVIGVDGDEGELGEFGDVRAVRQRPGTGWGDLIGGHVVADLEQYWRLDPRWQLWELRQRGDVGPFD
jgi:hypothetical protein